MLCDSKFCSHVDHVDSDDISVLLCSYVVEPGIIVVMYVAKVPNRGSPPAVLLRESYREAGKVKNRTLANLSSWPEAKVDALARVLKGQLAPAAAVEGTFEIARSLPHGHVAAVLGTARALGLEELLDPAPSRQRDLVTAIAIAQVIAPGSKLAIARGLREETAASSLGEVLGVAGCDEDDLYGAMDWLAARQDKIEDALAARHLAGGRWSFTTCRRLRSRAGPARWAPSATPKTGSAAGCRSSTGCSPPPAASQSPSRCSPATPATPRPSPPR